MAAGAAMIESSRGGPAAVVWFRQDLRLDDNPALRAAAETERPVVPLFIWPPEEDGHWAPGAASRWWLHHSLRSLSEGLLERGSKPVIKNGPALEAIRIAARRLTEEWTRCEMERRGARVEILPRLEAPCQNKSVNRLVAGTRVACRGGNCWRQARLLRRCRSRQPNPGQQFQ